SARATPTGSSGGAGAAPGARRLGIPRAGRSRAMVPGPRGTPVKWLIVTGDDFGMSHGINRGVLQAHRDGILTTASLLVNGPASEEAADLGRACPGLHLELDADEARRVSAQIDLVGFRDLHALATYTSVTEDMA